MDFKMPRIEHTAAVPFDGGFALGVVLRGGAGDGRELAINAPARRAIYPDAILRNPEDGLVARRARARGQRETDTSVDATDGVGSDVPEASAVGSGKRAPDLSVSAAQPQDRTTEPRVVERHNLYPPTAGICISGGDHGLVQPLCAGVGGIGFLGERLLRGSTGLGVDEDTAGYLQYRPRGTVHQREFYQASGGAGHYDQHGRAWSSNRQHFHRTFMANGEIRRGLSERLRRRAGSGLPPQTVFHFLQPRPPASVVGLSDAGSGLLR